jgi:hypothetical protein
MGYAFESFSTTSGQDKEDIDQPEGWSGDVNTNVQVCLLSLSSTMQLIRVWSGASSLITKHARKCN